MEQVDKIADGQNTIAIILRSGFKKDGIEFFTPGDFSSIRMYMRDDTPAQARSFRCIRIPRSRRRAPMTTQRTRSRRCRTACIRRASRIARNRRR